MVTCELYSPHRWMPIGDKLILRSPLGISVLLGFHLSPLLQVLTEWMTLRGVYLADSQPPPPLLVGNWICNIWELFAVQGISSFGQQRDDDDTATAIIHPPTDDASCTRDVPRMLMLPVFATTRPINLMMGMGQWARTSKNSATSLVALSIYYTAAGRKWGCR